jgi:hypothetical protein
MKTQSNIYNEYYNNFAGNIFGCIQEDAFNDEQPNDLFIKFEGSNQISRVVANDEVPKNLYADFINSSDTELDIYEFNSSGDHVSDEIISIICEDEFQSKTQKAVHNTFANNSTIEIDSQSSTSSKKSYEYLFMMIEDKNMYQIGSDEDSLTPTNSNELISIDRIISDSSTDMNNFIGDMLKHCPCDNLVKKQRIYKAKNITRKRKSKVQIKQLEKEFKICPNWDKDDFKRLSETLGLNRDQIYKWFWDQKKKNQE